MSCKPFGDDFPIWNQSQLKNLQAQLKLTRHRYFAWLFWSACATFVKPNLIPDRLPGFVALCLLSARVCRDTTFEGPFWQRAKSAVSDLLSNVQTAPKVGFSARS